MDLEEKERIYIKILRRLSRNWLYIDNKLLRKVFLKSNKRFWENLGLMKKPRFVEQNLQILEFEGLIQADTKTSSYTLTKKGKAIVKRGWIYREKNGMTLIL